MLKKRLAPYRDIQLNLKSGEFYLSRFIMNTKLKAISLTEILIVMVIVGILLLVALPNQTALISQAKSQEAKHQLEFLHTLEKQYFFMNSKYSASLDEVGFEHEKLTTEGGNANYRVEIVEASATTFKARATAIVDFDQDGQISVWEIDHNKQLKETTKD